MIEFTKAFKTSDGETHGTLEAAQRHELLQIFIGMKTELSAELKPGIADHATDTVLANSDRIVDILTTTVSSRPKARKANGGTKKRTPKAATATAPTTAASMSPKADWP